ncbi:uracil-xanthine permease family protein [Collinsella ihumii]|uniref:uracil-xanthine permease family protein n=1 Tax=Collinsella ihumii TaxID=1720204 RepID=UPI0025AAE0ED|nr:solute carrier family 23 protein [Collinsella ihumii]MDN0056284.1 solute carrier family 23 protein [Collinsella ihumii]
MANGTNNLAIGVNDRVEPLKAVGLAFLHVLAMDLYVCPIVLAAMLGLDTEGTNQLIQICFFTAGIATLIQTGIGIKLPVVQGASFVALSALATIGANGGMAMMVGSIIPGAIILILLGATRLFAKIVRRCIPPYIGGLIIVIVGLSLTPTAAGGVFSVDGGLASNMAPGLASMITLVIMNVVAYKTGYRHHLVSVLSVLCSLVVGCVAAAIVGVLDFSTVATSAWFAMPMPFHFGLPVFDIPSIVLMTFIYFIVLIETTGVWFTVGDVTDEELTDERLNHAVMGEGLGCLVGSLFGGTPLTGYSTNAGIISITKVASRTVVMVAGVILVILGMCPKLMAVISSVPEAAICGVLVVVCQILVVNGLRIIINSKLDQKKMLVIGLSLIFTVASLVLSADVKAEFPVMIQYLVSSGTAVGGIIAVVLNLLLPEDPAAAPDSTR